MGDPDDDAPRLVAAPRHLRRRALREEIPDTLLVPGVEPVPYAPRNAASAKRAAELDPDDGEVAYRRKRMLALISVIIVALSVPTLILALLLAG